MRREDSPGPARRAAWRGLLLVSGLILGACFDLGSPGADATVAPADTGPDAGPREDAATPCVEGPVDPSTPGLQIRIASFNVDRPQLSVPSGGVVVWTNQDSMPHEMVAGAPGAPIAPAEGGFDSGELATGQAYAHRFCRARTLTYYCSTHPRTMKGFELTIP